MKQAKDEGYRYVCWVDSIISLQQQFCMISDIIDKYGYYFSFCKAFLKTWTSDKCLEYFNMNRASLGDKFCLSSGLMFFDTLLAAPNKMIDEMVKLSIVDGPYCGDWTNDNMQVSRDLTVKGHRHDQTVATLLAYEYGMDHFCKNGLTYEADLNTEQEYHFRMMR